MKITKLIQDLREKVREHNTNKKNNRVPIEKIHQIGKELWKIDCLENSRKVQYVTCRTLLYTIMRESGYSLIEIEKYSGYDHSTVLYALKNKRLGYEHYQEKLKAFRDIVAEYVVTIPEPQYIVMNDIR